MLELPAAFFAGVSPGHCPFWVYVLLTDIRYKIRQGVGHSAHTKGQTGKSSYEEVKLHSFNKIRYN